MAQLLLTVKPFAAQSLLTLALLKEQAFLKIIAPANGLIVSLAVVPK